MARPKKSDIVDLNPPDISSENSKEKSKIGVAKISASYGRKVNLKGISSQYDNIDESFYATCWITFKDPEEFKRKSGVLSNAVREITENEIGKSISKLTLMKEDPENDALLGLGSRIKHSKFIEDEFGDLSDFLKDGDEFIDATIKELSSIEEIELDSIEL